MNPSPGFSPGMGGIKNRVISKKGRRAMEHSIFLRNLN